MLCQFCNKEFITKQENRKFCNRTCMANAMVGKKYDQNRCQNIKAAKILKISDQQMELITNLWQKHYVTETQAIKISGLSQRVYRRLFKEKCQHKQIKYLDQKVAPEIYEQIIELCRQQIPYKDIAMRLGFENKWMRHAIVLMSEFYSIKPLPRERPEKTPEQKKKTGIIIANYNRTNPKKREKNPNWRGGISKVAELIRKSLKYQEWRTSILKRDAHKCIFCNSRRKLEADHVYPFCLILYENKIKSLDEAYNCETLWNIDNGRTLCRLCHEKTETYAKQVSMYKSNSLILENIKTKTYGEKTMQLLYKREKSNQIEEVKYSESEEITFEDLAARLNINDLDTPEIYDILDEGYEVLSYNQETGKEEWKSLELFVVKKNSEEHYQLGSLKGTADHRVLYKNDYVKLKDHPEAKLVKEKIQVVDCEVADNHNYVAEGQINHNTTTPGGLSIPYSCSLRIKLDGGSLVKDGERVIGINVRAKTIKNRMTAPFREASFRIIFGKGIEEDSDLFDALREWCEANEDNPCIYKDKKISISGTAGWKYFIVSDAKTDQEIINKKFYKDNFREDILDKPEYKEYMKALLETALCIQDTDKGHFSLKGPNMENPTEAEAALNANKTL